MESFKTLVADAPWLLNDHLPGPKRGATKHYDCMSVEDLCNFELPPLADDCYLFFWRLASMVPEAYRVIESWGFTAKTELVWIKKTTKGKRWFGMGRHLRAEHETCVVAVRGRPKPLVRNIRSTFEARAGRHSEKPDEFYSLVESFCDGPRVELFARKQRSGWICLGNEVESAA